MTPDHVLIVGWVMIALGVVMAEAGRWALDQSLARLYEANAVYELCMGLLEAEKDEVK